MNTLPLALRYERFHNSVFSGLEEELLPSGIESLPEMELQSLWYAGEFGSEFTAVDGRQVVVKDLGIWNSGAGPDFRHCSVQVDGQALRGDIELDPDVRDWEKHAHGSNDDYDEVVLHLYVRQPDDVRFFTRTSGHREVVQVQLTDAQLKHSGLARPSRQAAARLGRCAAPLAEMSEVGVNSLLQSAAQHRLQKKSQRLHHWVMAHGREQAVYQALAQTLGYRSNALPFVMLAQRLPLKRLLKLAPNLREAMLFGAAGAMDAVAYDDTQAETRTYLRALWEDWWRVRDEMGRWLEPTQRLQWKVVATRPGNHPQRRLGALCALLGKWKEIMAPLESAKSWNAKAWRNSLDALSHSYWDSHYTLLAAPAAKPLALLGKTRVQEMMANVVYPLLVRENETLWQEYTQLPALLENEKVRRASARLFGQNAARATECQRKLYQQQALLQLYEDFCLEDDSGCEDCPFPERLKEWQL